MGDAINSEDGKVSSLASATPRQIQIMNGIFKDLLNNPNSAPNVSFITDRLGNDLILCDNLNALQQQILKSQQIAKQAKKKMTPFAKALLNSGKSGTVREPIYMSSSIRLNTDETFASERSCPRGHVKKVFCTLKMNR